MKLPLALAVAVGLSAPALAAPTPLPFKVQAIDPGATVGGTPLGTAVTDAVTAFGVAGTAVQAAGGNASAVILGAGKTGSQVQAAQVVDEAAIAVRLPLAGGTMTGTLVLPTLSAGTITLSTALPTADPLVAGQWWNNAGLIAVSAGP